MGYTLTEFENLEKEFGAYSTWAVWEYSKDRHIEKSVNCIKDNLSFLNSRHVLIGLNISNSIDYPWGNFRGGKHDRKLKYALNHSEFKGSYMTDLIKEIVEVKSSLLYKSIKGNNELIRRNVETFIKEMKAIKITPDTKFIILGSMAAELYKKHFQKHFPQIETIYHTHYSSRGTDKNWVESFCDKLAITMEGGYEKTKEKYK